MEETQLDFLDDSDFEEQLEKLDKLSREETDQMKQIVREIVDTYHPEKGEQQYETI